jgi:hypothetical protein
MKSLPCKIDFSKKFGVRDTSYSIFCVNSILYDFGYVKSKMNSFMASIATSFPTTMPTSAHIQFYVDSDGATGDDLDHDGDGAAYDDIDDDSNGAAGDKVDDDGNKVDDDGDGAKLSLPSMRRRLRRCRDGVVTLVVMASLPSPMGRRLAVVDDDGDSMTGDNDDGRDGLCRRCDGVVALVTMASYDGDSATGDEVDDNGDGATGYDDDGNDDGR